MFEFEDIYNNRRAAKEYIRITSEMGPSEQLLAFLGVTQEVGSCVGLESLDSMSLQTRHEIVLMQFKNITTEDVALEGLGSFFKKLANQIGSKPKGEDFKKYAGAKLELVNDSRPVTSYGFYGKHLSLGKESLKILQEALSKTKADDAYYKKVQERCDAIDNKIDQFNIMTPMKKSGWNESNLKSSITDFVGYEKVFDSLSDKVNSICDKYKDKPQGAVPENVLAVGYAYNICFSVCNMAYHSLNKAASCFKIKD